MPKLLTIRQPLIRRHIVFNRSGIMPASFHSKVLSAFDAEFARLQEDKTGANGIKGGMKPLGTAGDAATSGTQRNVESSEAHVPFTSVKNTPRVPAVAKPPLTQQDEERSYSLYSYKTQAPASVRMYIRDEAEADEQVSKLKGPLGFDMEWRVLNGKTTGERRTAVLQLCDLQTILIIQLSAMKEFPANVKAVVGDKNIVKMGVNILGDGRKLYRDYGVVSRGLLELTNLAHLVDPIRVPTRRMISLKRIVELYTGYTLSKGDVRISNWEAKLSEKQLQYAANDAHSALRVYNELIQIAREKEMVLRPVVTPSNTGQPAMGMTYVSSLDGDALTATTAEGSVLPAQSKPASRRFGVVPVTSLEQRQEMESHKPKQPVQGQLLRAYKLWHEERLSLPEMCAALRSRENPLAQSTVITYVVEALKADESLAFSRERLKDLAMLDFGSWWRHRRWIGSLEDTGRGVEKD